MEHDWKPLDQDEDPNEMCTVCFECKCCSDWTDECAGEWTPEDLLPGPSEFSIRVLKEWREGK